MLEHVQGNLLQRTDVEALVNPVNCKGVMGKGIALQFKRAFPENYRAYQKSCRNNEVRPGKMFVFKLNVAMDPQYIINFPTKRHWKSKSRIEDIESGLKALIQEVEQRKIKSIAIPALGSGLGGLNWDDVRPMIERAFEGLSGHVRVLLYGPQVPPDSRDMLVRTTKPRMTSARAGREVARGGPGFRAVNRPSKGAQGPFEEI